MHNRKTMVLGSWWALVRFALVFAKSVALVPLILSFWDTQLYTFWVLLLAANALWSGVYDGYIRYVTNAYNLYYYNEPQKATGILGSGFRFSSMISLLLLAGLALIVWRLPGATGAVFKAGNAVVQQQKLGLALLFYIGGNTFLNLLRFFYALHDPQGKLWRNLRFEVVYSIAEILVLVLSLMCLHTFYLVVAVNALLYIIAAVVFVLSVRKRLPGVGLVVRGGSIKQGAGFLRKSLPFIANNFIEKLATDSYSLLLSFFAWPALVIQQFASVRTMTNAGISGMNIFQTVTVPRIQELESKKEHRALLEVLRKLWLLAAFLCGTLLIPAYPLLERIYLTWTKNKITFDPLIFGLLFICLLVVLFGNVLLYYFKSVNATRIVLMVTVVKVAVLFSLLLFLPRTAVNAVADLLIAETIANILLYPFFAARKWRAETGSGFIPVLLQFLLPFLLIAGVVAVYLITGFHIVVAVIGYVLLLAMLVLLFRNY